MDGLDRKTTPQQNATPAQLETEEIEEVDAWSSEPIDYAVNVGGPAWIRTRNQQIMSLLL